MHDLALANSLLRVSAKNIEGIIIITIAVVVVVVIIAIIIIIRCAVLCYNDEPICPSYPHGLYSFCGR